VLSRHTTLTLLALVVALVGGARAHAGDRVLAPAKVLFNHLGFDQGGTKHAVLQAEGDLGRPTFAIVDEAGNVASTGVFTPVGLVDRWHTGRTWIADFSSFDRPGTYRLRVDLGRDTLASEPFTIAPRVVAESALPALIDYFRSQHVAGAYDETDRQVQFFGGRPGRVDVHGGWYDASGDQSKYLSHLCYTNYLSPQQTPLVVWAMLESAARLEKAAGPRLPALAPRILEEAVYGADFLTRMQDPSGYFYLSITDVWTHDPEQRFIAAFSDGNGTKTARHQASYRDGGGLAIAALARASKAKIHGAFKSAEYLAAAEKGFAHLEAHNLEYLYNGRETITDDYGALLAAAELFAATGTDDSLRAARRRSESLVARQVKDGAWPGHWQADETGRPYFHAAEAGLPVVALLRYLEIEPEAARRERARRAVQDYLVFELEVTSQVANPFGYARQLVRDPGGEPRTSFFFPHKNESAYWWQGENARLASIAVAARRAAPLMPAELKARLLAHATHQIDWILGANPFDCSMLYGKGRNNPDYLPAWPNVLGGVSNGITAGVDDEHDVAFLPEPQAHDDGQNWRWSEQWIPHAGWLMLALSVDAR
jgi:hypothetical protein